MPGSARTQPQTGIGIGIGIARRRVRRAPTSLPAALNDDNAWVPFGESWDDPSRYRNEPWCGSAGEGKHGPGSTKPATPIVEIVAHRRSSRAIDPAIFPAVLFVFWFLVTAAVPI